MTPSPNTQWNDADDDLLSAYIDNDLADGERAAFEARLQREPALQAALDDLRATVTLLHDLPQLTPPRSFTLDPAVHSPRWQRWVSLLWRFSALAAVMLALTFTLELMGSRSAPSTASMPVGGSAGMARSASNSAPAAAPMIADAPTAAPAATAAAEAAAAMAPAATSEAASSSAADTASGAANAPMAAEAPMAAKQEPTSASAASSIASNEAQPGSTLAQSRMVTNSGSVASDTTAFEPPPASESHETVQPIQATPRRLNSLRVFQIGLGVLTVLLAGAALWIARRHA